MTSCHCILILNPPPPPSPALLATGSQGICNYMATSLLLPFFCAALLFDAKLNLPIAFLVRSTLITTTDDIPLQLAVSTFANLMTFLSIVRKYLFQNMDFPIEQLSFNLDQSFMHLFVHNGFKLSRQNVICVQREGKDN